MQKILATIRRALLGAMMTMVVAATLVATAPTVSAEPSGGAGGKKTGVADIPKPKALKAEPISDPKLPSLVVKIRTDPDAVEVGRRVKATVTVDNQAAHAAEDLVVTMAVPEGAVPVGAAKEGWRWTRSDLDRGAQASFTAELEVKAMAPGRALVLRPRATARGLDLPIHEVGGALVTEPSKAVGSSQFTPGQGAALRSADGQVEVTLGPGSAGQPLSLQARPEADKRAKNEPVPPALAGSKRGLGTFFVDATDASGSPVGEFAEPVKVSVRYTPEQLEVAGMAEDDLTLFSYDADQRTWEPLATTVDPEAKTASAEVAQANPLQLSDGSSPSAAFIPSLQGWQVDHQTGSSSFSYPIDVPAGPAGIRPNLQLSYNSAATDGDSGKRSKAQAGWVGKGWSLDTGSVSRNKITVNPITNTWVDHFALTFGGRSFDLVRAEALAGNTGVNDPDPTHWAWRPTHESFIRARAVPNGTSTDGSPGRGGMVNGRWQPRHTWRIWDKGGTVHEFSEDLWWGFDRCAVSNRVDLEAYRWLLSKTVDTHGNTITYNYGRQTRVGGQRSCDPTNYARGTVDRDAWPTSITWGANTATGAGDRFKVDFLSTWRDNDTAFEGAANQYLGPEGQPRETRKLLAVAVSTKAAGSWELVRRYGLETDYSLLSDRTVSPGGVYSGDAAFPKLTLKWIERVASDGTTALPRQRFTYHTTRGVAPLPAGGWNRLATADNGQGGSVSFAYDNIGTFHGPLFANNHRVKTRILDDGRGNRPAWQIAYGIANYNSLGTTLSTATQSGTQANPNSAALYFNKYWQPNPYENRLAHRPLKEFRGHESVTETAPDGTSTEHSFYLGDHPCGYPRNTSGGPATGNAIYANPCFQALRDREFLKGREHRTVVRSAAGAILAATEREFAVEFDAASGYSNDPLTGLWRAFSYEKSVAEHTYNGAAALTDAHVTKTTRYAYDPALQGGGRQWGNLTTTEEYGDGGALERVSERFFAARDEAATYIVDRVGMEVVRDGERRLLALTHHFYDGADQTATSVGTKGDLTRTAKYYDVPLQANALGVTLHGRDTTFGYDAYGNPTSSTTYAGPGTRLWSGGGNIAISPPGDGSAARTSRVTFDSTFHALPVRITGPTGLVQQAAYDMRMGSMTSVTDVNGNAAGARYDAFGRMVKLIKPGDSEAVPTVAAFYYDAERPFRHVVCAREVAGGAGCRPMQSFYDGLGRLIQSKSESAEGTQNIVVDKAYDGLGRVVRESQPRYRNETPSTTFWRYLPPGLDAEMRWTNTSYDGLGRPTASVEPGDARTDYRYGVETQGGAQVAVIDGIDPNRHRTQQRHDALGRLVGVRELSGECDNTAAFPCGPGQSAWADYATTTYAYSPLDLLTSVTDHAGNRTTMSYDSGGRKLAMADPDMGAWRYRYDPNGNLITQTDAAGRNITFRYDALERLTTKILPDGTRSTYSYDEAVPNGKGRRTSMTTATETTKWAYDARGRPTQATHTIDGVIRTLKRTYDSADRLQDLTYPSGEKVSYRYDAGWRPTSLCAEATCYVQSATWTALDQPDVWKFGSSLTEDSNYESPTARLAQITVGSHSNRSYRYDKAGNVKAITDNRPGGAVQSFNYDHQDRLVAWVPSVGAAAVGYAYDPIGNLTRKDGQTYDYAPQTPANGGPHAVKAKGGQPYRYDANGNLLSGGGRTLTWTAENLPATAKGPDGVLEAYGYDGDGARVKKVRAGVKTTYLEDLWEETTGKAPTSYYRFGDRVVAMSRGKVPTYLHGDHLGSVSVATNATGGLVSRQEFDPWGKVRSGGVPQTDLNYTGQRLDGTGLLYYRARMYDPSLARFVSADTVVPMPNTAVQALTVAFHETLLLGSLNARNRSTASNGFSFENGTASDSGPPAVANLNRYSYALNNPLTYTDPSGHRTFDKNNARRAKKVVDDVIPELEKIRKSEKAWMNGGAGLATALGGLVPKLAKIAAVAGGAQAANSGIDIDVNYTEEAIDTLKWMSNQLDDFIANAPAGSTIEFFFYIGGDGTAYLVAVTRDKYGNTIKYADRKVSYEIVYLMRDVIGRIDDPHGHYQEWLCPAWYSCDQKAGWPKGQK